MRTDRGERVLDGVAVVDAAVVRRNKKLFDEKVVVLYDLKL